MKLSLYHCLFISSLSLLTGCSSPSDTENAQSQVEKSETATSIVSDRKVYIDPETGELTSMPPASKKLQRNTVNIDDGPVVFDEVVNDHGVKIFVPRNPVRHELKVQVDCNGNLQTGHDLLDQPKNCEKNTTKGVE